MKVLKKGKAHLHTIWTSICPYCDSKIRILDGDPMSYYEWHGQYGHVLKYICPVCGGQVEHRSHSNSNKGIEREENVRLTKEDREEIESWGTISWDTYKDMDESDRDFIHGYRYYPG